MTKRFLVASDDEPVSAWEPVVVSAESKEEAIDRYLRIAYSKDPVFRDGVMSLTINDSFLEQFFIVTRSDEEKHVSMDKGKNDLNLVKARVRSFFFNRPDLGEKYVRYMDTRDTSLVDDDLFEFISAADPGGIIALDIDDMRQL